MLGAMVRRGAGCAEYEIDDPAAARQSIEAFLTQMLRSGNPHEAKNHAAGKAVGSEDRSPQPCDAEFTPVPLMFECL